jgi:hypothetical protein
MTPERMTFVLQLMAIFAATIVAISICSAVVAKQALSKVDKDAAGSLVALVNGAGGLQMVTVLVIGMSAFLLRLLDQISADAAVSALTGIAGFVLGGFTRQHPKPERDDQAPGNST